MKTSLFLTTFLGLASTLGVALAGGGDPPTPGRGRTHASIMLIAEDRALVPGTTATLSLRFTIDPKWHIYWDGLNDSGMPPRIRLTAPEGFEVGGWKLPAPARLVSPGDILDHVYEGTVMFLVDVKVPASATGRATFKVVADWLVCHEVCLPESGEGELTLPVLAKDQKAERSTDAPAFEEARRVIPKPWPKDENVWSFGFDQGMAKIAVAGASRLEFHPGKACAPLADPITSTVSTGSRLKLRVAKPAAGDVIAGVVRVERGGRTEYYEVDSRVGPTPAGTVPDGGSK